jgi:hypothetical protein
MSIRVGGFMGTDPRKRQKKLEKRAAKRKEKKHVLARSQIKSLTDWMSADSKYPVLHCWIPDNLKESGIGWVVLSRELPNGQVAVAAFLVDSYCLGVKNIIAQVLSRSDYDIEYLRKSREMPSRPASPAEARKLVEQAVAYAHSLGFSPHEDYAKVMRFFGDINSADSDAEFEFGKDGKPFFFAGPRDNPARCKQIIATLTETCGPGNFHFMMPMEGDDLEAARRVGNVRILGPDGEEYYDAEDELEEAE